MQNVIRKLEKCQNSLKGWNRWKYGNVEETIKKKTKQLINLQKQEGNWNRVEIN